MPRLKAIAKKKINRLRSVFESRTNNSHDANSAPRLTFIHVPKCAGTSLVNAIGEHYGASRRQLKAPLSKRAAHVRGVPLDQYRKHLHAYELALKRERLLTGHWGINEALLYEFREEWRFVTVLRDPVERWKSEFFFNRYKDNQYVSKITQDLPDFIETPQARSMGETYLRFFSDESCTEKAIAEAKRVIDQFDLVGVVEDLGIFRSEFQKRFGLPIDIGISRVSPAKNSQKEHQLTDKMENLIHEYCAPDRALYEHARKVAGLEV